MSQNPTPINRESQPDADKETATERLSRFGRNINVLGAAAIAGMAVVIPGPNAILAGWAGLNAAQAGGFELLRQHARHRRLHQSKP